MLRLTLLALLLAPLAFAAPPGPAPKSGGPVAKPAGSPSKSIAVTDVDFPLGPMPPGVKVGWSHAPYQEGDCSICHERKDAKNPGKIIAPVNELCLSCHEEFSAVLSRPHVHKPTKKSCSNCHNAHDSPEKKLLHAEVTRLCKSCHDEMINEFGAAKVKHLAVERDAKCLNCHNAHGSSYERLLVKAPFDLCISCHDNDSVKDASGKVLTNFATLLKENPTHHKPVAEKDCSACHAPHSSPNFRLLVDPYPAEFYSDFDAAKYKLCFECHRSDVVTSKETTTLTRFRDGSKNLHFVHVNQAEKRGRTCRACHEVHASKQPHIVRDAVPFGPRGWMLKVNFRPLPNGGTCDKTCHAAKSYVNRLPGEKEATVPSLKDSAKPQEVPKPVSKADPRKAPEKKN